ncbi:hypothetical protein EV359DRAFT_69018 [Lentinula novae-zelandiae]|nr:hypothetical protein EV359DRAFT_69018 [Lentinula novae-zelandiae]
MDAHARRLVRYVVGDVGKELLCAQNYVERRLVLLAHDEMTVQANDAQVKHWVFQNQHMLRKKGVGRGIHQSDVICSTVGWLKGASQSMEYGKNYEGYWNGEIFLKEKIIPVFEEVHGPGYQALIMVDNSQGHSAYAEDALLTSRMNVGSGGKQARLRNGWYLNSSGTRVSQSMVFPKSHPEYLNQPKGIKQILSERGIPGVGSFRGKCKKCDTDSLECCCKKILENQPDFLGQMSLVEEVPNSASLLPKLPTASHSYQLHLPSISKRWLRVTFYTSRTLY